MKAPTPLYTCCRCGITQFTMRDGAIAPVPPVCGWCAALEIINDDTWKWQRASHNNALWAEAKQFVDANTDSDIIAQLGIDRAQLRELRARVGRRRMAA